MPSSDPNDQESSEGPGCDDPDPSNSGPSVPLDEPGNVADITVSIALHTEDPDPPLSGWLDVQLAKAVELEGICVAQIALAIVADEEMAQLHEQYTGVAGTTDVLTFDLRESGQDAPGATALDADIILCLDEAARQASERGHPLRHEMLLYAVHGLMHLLGEDDHDEKAYQHMHAREDALLERLGVGRVFSSEPKP